MSQENPPQLNQVRAEYVTSDDEPTIDELEAQIEQSISQGPSIGEDGSATPPTGFDAVTTTLTGVWIAWLTRLADWRSEPSRRYRYDWSNHLVTATSDDPDPDTHPAEAAGMMQALSTVFPWFCWWGLAVMLVEPVPLLGLLLAVPCLLALKAPKPVVDCTARGLGRHVAQRDESE